MEKAGLVLGFCLVFLFIFGLFQLVQCTGQASKLACEIVGTC